MPAMIHASFAFAAACRVLSQLAGVWVATSVIFMAGSRVSKSEGAFRVVAAAARRAESLASNFPEIVLPWTGSVL